MKRYTFKTARVLSASPLPLTYTFSLQARARCYHDRFSNFIMYVFASNMKEHENLAIFGPFRKDMIAYVGPTMNPSNQNISKRHRTYEVRCITHTVSTDNKLRI